MTDQELREKAASALISLNEENVELSQKIASAEKHTRCVKIARKMVEKGLLRDNVEDFLDKVAEMETHDNLDGLDVAVDIAVQGFSVGETADSEKNATESTDSMEALIHKEMAAQGL